MSVSYTKRELKFLKALTFWEFRTKALEYFFTKDYCLTVIFPDGRHTLIGLTLPDLENSFEQNQFSDWVFVICKKYKYKFEQLKIHALDGEKRYIDLSISK